jgi:serine/threonine protein kinase/tetratricopeptide (TPR) repeat protein
MVGLFVTKADALVPAMRDDGGKRRVDSPRHGNAGVRTPSGEISSSDQPTLLNVEANKIHSEPRDPAETLYGAPSSPGMPSPSPPSLPLLEAGTIIGGRYEILEMLGIGGMGEVYKAKDLALGRLVALKVIKPELTRTPAIIDRFKQEILLSSTVTHKNVIRIFDLGEADGMKFITMEYVEGKDLRAVLTERGKYASKDAIAVVRQVCFALEAAHAAGVIHRDLKPQNIMCEPSGRILVMDFGLARTLDDTGLTQSGNLVGTLEYMSPEQALAKEIDQRSDIFALGIIFYELLSGRSPYQAHSAVASLIMRTQESVEPLTKVDPAIPENLSGIVSKCLERDVELRYQTISELRHDLDIYEGGGSIAASLTFRSVSDPTSKLAAIRAAPWKWAAGALSLLIILLSTFFLYRSKTATTAHSPAATTTSGVSLAVFPLRNASGISSIDWMSASLADMISTAIGQSTQLRTVSPEKMRQIYADMRLTPQSTIDDSGLRRLAEFAAADNTVSGQYTRIGDQLYIEVAVADLKTGRSTTLKAQSSEKDLPSAINNLADSIRKNLSLSSADIKVLQAQALQPTSTSVDALRDYNEALMMTRAGRNIEAQGRLSAAIDADPRFALAYALLSHVKSELGYQAEAEQISRRAVELSESQSLPPLAKSLVRANHLRVIKQNDKAIEAYQALAHNLPGDEDLKYVLSSLYIETSDYEKARAQTSSLLKEDPKSIRGLWQMAVIEISVNNPQGALDPLNQALSLTIQTDNQESKALVLLAIGISYKLLNKPDDALRNYQESIALNEKLGQKRGVAAGFAEIAQVQTTSGNSDAALASYQKALKILRDIGMTKEVGDTLTDMGGLLFDRGQTDQALAAFQEALRTQRQSGDEYFEALCLNNIASVYGASGDTGSALTYYQQALQLREKLGVPGYIAETLNGIGRIYTQDGQYDEALKTFVRAADLARKANTPREAALIAHQLGLVFVEQGRYGAAVSSIQDALNGLKGVGEQKSRDVALIQNDLAMVFARSGRLDEAQTSLDSAQAIAHDLKGETLTGPLFNTQGTIDLYRGNPSAASQQFQKALKGAGRKEDRDIPALTQFGVARVALQQGRDKEAAKLLSTLLEKKEQFSKSLTIQISGAYSEALIRTKDPARARQILLANLGDVEKAGMRPQAAITYYLLGLAAKAQGNADEAASYSRQAVKTIDALKSEAGGDKILQRADMASLYKECSQTAPAK